MTPEQARAAAKKILGSVAQGHDPAADKTHERRSLALSDAIEVFLTEHVEAKRKASTAIWLRDALGSIKPNVDPYTLALDRPIVPLCAALASDLRSDRKRAEAIKESDAFEDEWSIAQAIEFLETAEPEAGAGNHHDPLIRIGHVLFDFGITRALAAELIDEHWAEALAVTDDIAEQLDSLAEGRCRDGKPWGVAHPRNFAAQPKVAAPLKRTSKRQAGSAAVGRSEPMSEASTSGRSMARNGQTGLAIVAIRNGIAPRRRGGMRRSGVEMPPPTRNDATAGPSRHPRARARRGNRASTTRERVERPAARKRFVAQVETANREIDLVGHALASPAERHSKLFARCA
jgi:predicted transcriptional regulator